MNRMPKRAATLALVIASAAAGYGAYDLVQNVQFARAEQAVETSREQLKNVEDLATVFRNVGKALEPSVVNIMVRKTVKNPAMNIPPELRRFFNRPGMPRLPQMPDNGNGDDNNDNGDDSGPNDSGPGMVETGEGSGVIIEAGDGKAYILTNNHVAGGATEMTVTLADGRKITDAKTLGTDPKTDLAVVQVNVDHVIPAQWGDSSQLAKGDWVLAFGSPLGYVGSMTHGIVSALHRTSDPTGGHNLLGQYGYEDFIQTDAPINPGNSGGPLVNIRGEVIGINTAIASRTGGFQGIGFAIPINEAHPIYDQLKKSGHVTRGWLGVEIKDVARAPDETKATGYAGTDGVLVAGSLKGTPANGKLMPGDVITSLNGSPVKDTTELRNQVADTAPGTTIKLGVFRDGKNTDVSVKLGTQPDNPMASADGNNGTDENGGGAGGGTATAQQMGVRLSDATDDLKLKYHLDNVADGGAIVTSVAPGSLAMQAGLQPGDLITRVGGTETKSLDDVKSALAKADLDKGVRLYVTNREGSSMLFVQKGKNTLP